MKLMFYTKKNKSLEVVLKEILPEAFAVVKETSRRFKENPELEVTALEHDRNLAANKNYILIDGNKAIWKNEWTAAGGAVKWDMLHYDVQLIGVWFFMKVKLQKWQQGRKNTCGYSSCLSEWSFRRGCTHHHRK